MAYNRFFIVTNTSKDPQFAVAKEIVGRLKKHEGVKVFVERRDEADILGCDTCELSQSIDLMLVIGGDGSVLDASDAALAYDIPLLGINLGHLGYLAEVEVEALDTLELLFDGEPVMTERMTLELTVERKSGEKIQCERYGANEVTLLHVEEFGLADLTMRDGTGNRIRYHGDGLIIATPTGSTGYSFSAGGPILSPALDNICVTPICPHSFFNRSMVFGAETEISVTNTTHDNERVGVSVDGRISYMLEAGDAVRVHASDKKLKTISFNAYPTFNTLRRKMELAELKD